MVNYRFDIFKQMKQFSIISAIELETIYNNLLSELIKEGWESTDTKLKRKSIDENKYVYNDLLLSKVENGIRNNIGINFQSRSVRKNFMDNGDFVYVEIPNEVMKNQTRFLHNSDLTILEKFLSEVNWDGEWESLMEEYDKVYPQKHSTNKKEGEFSWRANFAIVWFLSIRNQGFISPLMLFPQETLLARGTHRAYMLTKLGYDFPLFIPITNNSMTILSNDIFLDNKKLEIKIDVEQKKVEYNFK